LQCQAFINMSQIGDYNDANQKIFLTVVNEKQNLSSL
jgi:hypothetical protein